MTNDELCQEFPGAYQPEEGTDIIAATMESVRLRRRCAEFIRPLLDHYGYRCLIDALEMAATDDVDGQAVTEAHEKMGLTG